MFYLKRSGKKNIRKEKHPEAKSQPGRLGGEVSPVRI